MDAQVSNGMIALLAIKPDVQPICSTLTLLGDYFVLLPEIWPSKMTGPSASGDRGCPMRSNVTWIYSGLWISD
jgi:hypothetical protein